MRAFFGCVHVFAIEIDVLGEGARSRASGVSKSEQYRVYPRRLVIPRSLVVSVVT